MTASRLLPLSIVVGFSAVFAGCGGEGLTLPPEGQPANIEVIDPDLPRTGRVTETLPGFLTVRVTDSRGDAVPGATVAFSFPDGPDAGEADPETARTDADGRASTTLKLGTVAGTYLGIAAVEGTATPLTAEFTIKALPADANGIRIFSGEPQSGTVNSPLSQPLVVLVTDANNNPIPNVAIQWTAEGGGSVSEASTLTGVNGQASVTRTLGPIAGTQTTLATAEGLVGSPIPFTHTATAGSANLIAKISGDAQEATPGSELALPLIVQVVDAAGNPIANEPVTWVTSDGTFSSSNTTTDEQGFASTRWTIGSTPGINTATAVASRAGTSTVSFTATGTATPAPPPTQIQMHGGNGQEGPVNTTLAAPLSVKVTTATGAPVSGQAVIWLAVGGGSVSAASSLTNSDGIAEVQRTLGSTPGTYTTTATVSGLSGSPVTFTSTANAGGPSAANSGVSASPSTIPVGGQSTITVVVRDGSNNVLPGVLVSVTASGTGNSVTPGSASTGANGAATFTFSSTVAETKTITVNAGGVALNDSPTITVQKTSSTVEITEDEPDPSTVGTAITVEFSVGGSGGTPTGEVVVTLSGGDESCAATLSGGVGSCTLTPLEPGPAGNNNRRVITATYSGDNQFSGDTDTENHRVNPAPPAVPSASRSEVDRSPSDIPADGTTASTITVRVLDAGGNVMPNVAVTASASGTGNTITPAAATTDAAGVATFSFTSTVAEEKIITVTAGGVILDDQPHIQVAALGSTIEITSDELDPSTAGTSIHVTWVVAGEGSPTPTGTVTVFSQIEAAGCENVPVEVGFCDFILSEPGSHVLEAVYSGNAQFESSFDTDTHTVN